MTEPSEAIPTPLDIARRLEAQPTTVAEPKDGMFTPEQQAEVNRIVQERVQRVEAKYAAVDVEAAQQQLDDIQQQIRDGELAVMRNAIAARLGLAPEDRDLLLTGTDAVALVEQETRLAAYGFGRPLGNRAPREGQAVNEPSHGDRDMREFVDNLFGNNDW